MEIRKIGSQGLEVGAIGLGCMGMTHGYGTRDDAESIATIHLAIERGVTFFDTAEVYGPYTNEEILGKAIVGRRDGLAIATKFGFKLGQGGVATTDGTPANAKRAAEGSLKRLGVDVIDLYYLHRKDPAVPIEDSVGAMKELVEAGEVRYIGLSEVNAETIRRAHRVHPITAVQSEYSLWERGIEESILPAMRELGIGLVPVSPLGRGYLAGAVHSTSQFTQQDFRRTLPRFDDENLAANEKIVDAVRVVAARHSATHTVSATQITPAQIALAWVLAQGSDVVPIPGTKRRTWLEENLRATEIRLTAGDLTDLGSLAAIVSGERYAPHAAKLAER
jgi:aryl-alcohol dehydrogenase-like predicted oxidoreductase